MADKTATPTEFGVTCRLCGSDNLCGGRTKAYYDEVLGREMTAYAPPGGAGVAVGISEGDGHSFECIACHLERWISAREAKNPVWRERC